MLGRQPIVHGKHQGAARQRQSPEDRVVAVEIAGNEPAAVKVDKKRQGRAARWPVKPDPKRTGRARDREIVDRMHGGKPRRLALPGEA